MQSAFPISEHAQPISGRKCRNKNMMLRLANQSSPGPAGLLPSSFCLPGTGPQAAAPGPTQCPYGKGRIRKC